MHRFRKLVGQNEPITNDKALHSSGSDLSRAGHDDKTAAGIFEVLDTRWQ